MHDLVSKSKKHDEVEKYAKNRGSWFLFLKLVVQQNSCACAARSKERQTASNEFKS